MCLLSLVVSSDHRSGHCRNVADRDFEALVEPLAVAWHAISASPLQPSSIVLVLGGGPIGLAIVQCLRARGVAKVIVSEVSAVRRAFAQEFGAGRMIFVANRVDSSKAEFLQIMYWILEQMIS
jgi:threonine dehydrogenase-like Zn-dependent dehydrogenase